MIAELYESKGERIECMNYRGISLLIVAGKIYAGILVDRVSRVTEGSIDEEQGGFQIRESYQVPGLCSLSVRGCCMSHCSCLFFYMAEDNDMERKRDV